MIKTIIKETLIKNCCIRPFNYVAKKLKRETMESDLPDHEKQRQLRIMHKTESITNTILNIL